MSNDALKRRSAETAATYDQGNIANLDDAMTRRLIASTVMTESSGGKLTSVNAQGYAGRYQAGAQWLVDAGYVDGDKLKAAMKGYRTEWAWADAGNRDNMDKFLGDPSNWKNGLSLDKYLASADLQDKAFKINSDAAYRRAIKEGVLHDTDSPEKIAGFLKARHIAGYGGAKAAVTGGKEIEDSNGTSNYDYYNDIAANRDGLNQYMGQGKSKDAAASDRADESHVQAQSSTLKLHAQGPEVQSLQSGLKSLGYLGADGKPLSTDGDFGRNTEHAVRAFQQTHGLDVDGKVGPLTLKALAEARQHPLISEASHPNHSLYETIAKHAPAGTRPEVIANVAMQVRENGMSTPGQISKIAMLGNDMFVQGQMPGLRVRVDLEAPTASLQQISDHMREQSRQPGTVQAMAI